MQLAKVVGHDPDRILTLLRAELLLLILHLLLHRVIPIAPAEGRMDLAMNSGSGKGSSTWQRTLRWRHASRKSKSPPAAS